MRASDMPYGTTISDYKIVRRTHEEHEAVGHTTGSRRETAIGGRSSLYLGGHVAADEEVIDFPTVTKMTNCDSQFVWLQEPGGQTLTDDQVDDIVASGATVRLG